MKYENLLRALTERVEKAFGADLCALLLYGSAARGEYDEGHSDLNVLLVVERLDTAALEKAAPILSWWRELGQPMPLLFANGELERSSDAFPIELSDLQSCHRLLAGREILGGLVVDRAYHRAQLEHELRSKLLRLRQKAVPILRDRKLLLRLMEDSVSTFLVLIRHTMLLRGLEVPVKRRELLAAAGAAQLMEARPFLRLLDLREGLASPKAVEPVQLFEDYLRQIEALVAAVDRL
jgi:predicted nucleotidyltransferase